MSAAISLVSPMGGYVFRSERMGASATVKHEDIRRKAHRLMDEDVNAYSVIYIPLAVSEVVWDFVESVRDGMYILREPKLKPVSRKLRELRESYTSHFRSLGMLAPQLGAMKEWSEMFIEQMDGGREVTRAVRMEIDRLHPGVQSDWKALVIAAYVAYIFVTALIRYTGRKERDFAALINLPDYGHMLPGAVYALPALLLAVTGDCVLPREPLERLTGAIVDLLDEVAEESAEPDERTRHRLGCVAYRNNGGCRAFARNSTFGCYASARCRRMMKYDATHPKENKSE